MSLDRSLRTASGLEHHRSVLSRAEKVQRLLQIGKFDMQKDDPLGLPKVNNRKVVVGGKSKKRAAAGEEAE